jgi:hypothetical protein
MCTRNYRHMQDLHATDRRQLSFLSGVGHDYEWHLYETFLGGMSLRHVLVCPLSTPGCPQSVPPRVICCGDSVHSTLAVCAVKHHPGMPPCHAVDRHPRSPWASAPETTRGGEPHGPARHHAEKARLQEGVPGLATCVVRTIRTGVHVCCGGVGWLASVALDTCLQIRFDPVDRRSQT